VVELVARQIVADPVARDSREPQGGRCGIDVAATLLRMPTATSSAMPVFGSTRRYWFTDVGA
jgi:hypothetical protein